MEQNHLTSSMSRSFGEHMTAEEVAAQLSSHIRGKTILITGVSSRSLGAVFSETITKHAPKLLVLAGRNKAKIDATIAAIRAQGPPASEVLVRVLEIDLSSEASVRKAAQELLSWKVEVDVLVNNAAVGAMRIWERYTGADGEEKGKGLEYVFATNYLNPWLFTNLVMQALLPQPGDGRTCKPRVVNISSGGHRWQGIRFGSLDFAGGKEYDMWKAYGQSKTGNILFSVSLAQKLGTKGLLAYSLHPGAIPTNMGDGLTLQDKQELGNECLSVTRHRSMWLTEFSGWVDEKGKMISNTVQWKTLEEGAATHVVAAFEPGIEGKWCEMEWRRLGWC
jgi:NAD(P)-dependent dehydrogenase (short-subunit alcohol dehydrogenase family)